MGLPYPPTLQIMSRRSRPTSGPPHTPAHAAQLDLLNTPQAKKAPSDSKASGDSAEVDPARFECALRWLALNDEPGNEQENDSWVPIRIDFESPNGPLFLVPVIQNLRNALEHCLESGKTDVRANTDSGNLEVSWLRLMIIGRDKFTRIIEDFMENRGIPIDIEVTESEIIVKPDIACDLRPSELTGSDGYDLSTEMPGSAYYETGYENRRSA